MVRAVIYFVRPDGCPYCEGLIKIGSAKDPYARRVELQCGSPMPLVTLATIEGGVHEEHWLHGRFGGYRERAEWFRARKPLVELISEINSHEPGTFSVRALMDLFPLKYVG